MAKRIRMTPCCQLRHKDHNLRKVKGICYCTRQEVVEEEEPSVKLNVEIEVGLRSCMTELTEELLIEILKRLPRKCAYRSKAVCKSWCSLISSTYFANEYINFHPISDSFTVVFQYQVSSDSPGVPSGILNYVQAISTNPWLSWSFKNNLLDLNSLPKLSGKSGCTSVIVKASCHNLLLCSDLDDCYVVNLLTGQWRVLPHAHVSDQSFLTKCKVGLMCYHDQRDLDDRKNCNKLKVILIPTADMFEAHEVEFSIQIFCSELGQWSHFFVDWYPLDTSYYFSNIVAHIGLMHWINGRSLVSLDLFDDDLIHLPKLRYCIDLPEDVVQCRLFMLGVCQDQLRLAVVSSHYFLRVWEVENYEEGLWKQTHRINLRQSCFKGVLSKIGLLALHPYDENCIYINIKRKIYLFNMRTGLREGYCSPAFPGCKVSTDLWTVPQLLH